MSKLSVIVPMFNEKQIIESAIERIFDSIKRTAWTPEVIVVDNASTDGSSEIVQLMAFKNKDLKYIKFTRNFGPTVEASILAGYKYCSGEAAMVIYSDMQDSPEYIPDFLAEFEKGFDIVYGIQKIKTKINSKKLLVKLFYKLNAFLSDSPAKVYSGDFTLISRKVINTILDFPELQRLNRGLIPWTGYVSTEFTYSREPRITGKSKTNLIIYLKTALDSITSFSIKPLRFLTFLGIFLVFVSFVGVLYLIGIKLFGDVIDGITPVLILVLISISTNMLAFGLLGEYIGKIQNEVKGRPMYIIDSKINL